MSGLLPAVAYYEKNEEKIIRLLEYMYQNDPDRKEKSEGNLFGIIKDVDDKKEDTLKEDIIHYSISLKLVMNLYI